MSTRTNVNPFQFLCKQCESPWNDYSTRCWNCGSTETIPNPAYGQPIPIPPVPRLFQPITRDSSQTEPAVSETQYIVVAVIIGIVAGLSAFGSLNGEVKYPLFYAVVFGLVGSGLAWTIFSITITKRKVDRIDRMLEDLSRLMRAQ